MKNLLTSIFMFGYATFCYAQLPNLVETSYTAFNGSKYEVYLIEGEFTVFLFTKDLLTEKQLNDVETLHKIRDGIDGYYLGFKNIFGIEPVGGNIHYQNKANVFFGSPSCGAACGLLGAKGIEVGGNFLTSIFNETKFNTNTHTMVLVGYEFGRNFFTVGNKVLFPYSESKDERNGGFAEGFGNLGYLESYISFVAPTFSEDRRRYQETSFYHKQLRHLFLAYINDLSKNPYNCMLIENQIRDYNRNKWSIDLPAYIASGILVGTYNLFDKPDLKNFIQTISMRNQASTVEYALGSIALGFSKSINLNLNNFFEHVLKFEIDSEAKNQISLLPLIQQDKLIPDVEVFYFATPLDSITLNIRSINYNPNNTNTTYRITAGEEEIATSHDGNNTLHYSILKNKPFINLKISLLINGAEQDNYSVSLKKRHIIEYSEIIENSLLYSGSGTGIVTLDGESIVIKNSSEMLDALVKDNNIIQYSYPVVKDREIKITGEIKNKTLIPNEGWSNLAIGGRWGSHGTNRVGLDLGRNNDQEFFKVEQTMNSTFYFFSSEDARKLDYLELKFWLSTLNSNAVFRNFQIEDITDIDNDGFIDFEDDCPTIPGLYKGCPDTEAPTLVINYLQTVPLDQNGVKVITPELIDNGSFDNTGIIEKVISKTTFYCTDLGENTITFTARDASGNESTAEVIVNVVDEIKPILKPKNNYTITLDQEAKALLKWEDIDEGSTDNCGITERTLSKTEFTKDDSGEQTITYKIKDASGNEATAEIKIKVDVILAIPAINPEKQADIKLYPNPAKNSLFVEFDTPINYNQYVLEIVDATGRSMGVINNFDKSGKILRIDTNGLSNGVHFLKISKEGSLKVLKFIIAR